MPKMPRRWTHKQTERYGKELDAFCQMTDAYLVVLERSRWRSLNTSSSFMVIFPPFLGCMKDMW